MRGLTERVKQALLACLPPKISRRDVDTIQYWKATGELDVEASRENEKCQRAQMAEFGRTCLTECGQFLN